jgi:Domain of unknown function (DUF4082)/Fibronectin type III domain/Bacterial Ig domain
MRVILKRSAGLLLIAPLLALAALLGASSPALAAETNCSIAANPIVCENALPGDPKENWQVEADGDASIQGYATSMSVNAGETENFKINTPSSSYHIDILRLGYYGGDGARLIASNLKPTATLPQKQPACLTNSSTGLIDCGNWGVSATWTVPSTAVSGVYIAHLVRNDTGEDSQIPFVVRNDSSHSEILVQTSDATWEAYNDYGGNSLYTCTVACPPGEPEGYKAAYSVSYNRPFDGSLTTDSGASYLYYAEYQMDYWLEENGYNVSYTSESQVDGNGALLKNHKIFMSSGHDEYWSAGQRASVEAAREAGVNLAFFSGNEIFWKTRWGASTEGSNTPYRTLTTYKETHFNSPVDPQDPSTWTGSWRDPRFSPPADGGKPENSLSGQTFVVNSGTADLTVPSQYSKLRLWRNTAVATLKTGTSLTLAPGSGTLGYEWDEDTDNGFRPSGEFDLSSTTVNNVQVFNDFGTNPTTGTATHHLTLYRAPSGALVFGAGTVQWSWGLANVNAWDYGTTEPSENPPDPNMEQATVNLFADMGVQPGTLITGLKAATASTDKTAPTSTITSPLKGATLTDGSKVTISGSATDLGGGVVAGVEVSTNNGTTWHPATLTTAPSTTVSWNYAWAAHGNPTATIKSRAVDDSANLEKPAAGTTVNVSCPCSIWGSAFTPTTQDAGDGRSVELGVKFTAETFGAISGIRFYKASTNTGTHIGSLWNASGTLLASATFTSETASGWQQVNFSTPVQISPNTTYIAGYYAPNGHYSADPYYFYNPSPKGGNVLSSPPLRAVQAGPANTNGVYSYGSEPTYPTSSYEGSNYWVDPVFSPIPAPGQVTGVKAVAGTGSATVTWTAPASGGAVTTYTITPFIGASAQTPTVVTGSPPTTSALVSGLTAGKTYTFTVQASNPAGSGAVSSASNAVTPTAPVPPEAPTNVTAAAASKSALVSWSAPPNNGGSAITGYKVTPFIGSEAQAPVSVGATTTSTTITGLTTGTSYTFTVTAANSIGMGSASKASPAITLQDTILDFATPTTVDSGDASPVEVGVKFSSSTWGKVTGIRFYKAAANTGTHIGSLWNANGTLLASATFTGETASGWQQVAFSTPVSITPNTIYVAGYLAPNGHYSATGGAFASAGIENPPLTALSNSAGGGNGVYAYSSTSTFPSSSFNSTSYSVDVTFLPGPPPPPPGAPTAASAIPATSRALVSWTAPSEEGGSPITGYKITPYLGAEAQLPVNVSAPATSAVVTGLINGKSYTFTVAATNATGGTGSASTPSAAITPLNTIFDFTSPSTVDTGDTSSVELGVKFTSSASGTINGIRFYKAAANTGPHVGSLWSASGTLLASATFTGETASGWQQVNFSTPVQIFPFTTYVAGYLAPNGHYSATPSAFAGSVENSPLTALSNGLSGGNGVYAYSSTSTFPTNSYSATNYSVDVLFASSGESTPTAPEAPSKVSAIPATKEALVSWSAPGNGGSPITGYKVTPFIGTEAQSSISVGAATTSTTVTGLTNGASYTFAVAAVNAIGTGSATKTSPAITPQDTIFDFATPNVVDAEDPSSVELGVKFSSSVSGSVTGIRFYKAAANTGTHIGSLWNAEGTLLASATFTNETASGWQQMTFAEPVPITAGTTYVVGYLAPNGHYSATGGAFASAGIENPPLTAPANEAAGGNGVYAYGSTSTFPSNSFNSTSYDVDVTFAPGK